MRVAAPTISNHQDGAAVQIVTLGQAQVYVHGQAASWGARSAEELFWYLHAHPEGATRAHILSELWNQEDTAAAANRFRVALFRVRSALENPLAVTEHAGRFALSAELFAASDTAQLSGALAALTNPSLKTNTALTSGTPPSNLPPENLQQVLGYCQGLYLPHIQESWVQAERERWHALQVALQLQVAHQQCRDRQCALAACTLRAALSSDPYQPENLHQRLMGCLNVTESKYTAIEYYRRYLRFLAEEVGDTPMPETVELAQAIKLGEYHCQESIL